MKPWDTTVMPTMPQSIKLENIGCRHFIRLMEVIAQLASKAPPTNSGALQPIHSHQYIVNKTTEYRKSIDKYLIPLTRQVSGHGTWSHSSGNLDNLVQGEVTRVTNCTEGKCHNAHTQHRHTPPATIFPLRSQSQRARTVFMQCLQHSIHRLDI